MSLRITHRWVLVLLVVSGQLLLLVPGSFWLVNWLDGATRDIVARRLDAAITRHVVQIGGLITDMRLQDLEEGTPDRARLQNLLNRTGHPYGATLVVCRMDDRTLLAWPEPDASRNGVDPVVDGVSPLADLSPVARLELPQLNVALQALPNESDVADLVRQFNAYVRRIVFALLALVVLGATGLTFLIVHRYENRLAGINDGLEQLVEERTADVVRSRNAVVYGLAMLAESRDGETGEHLDRIYHYVRVLGDDLKQNHPEIDDEFMDIVVETSVLHDIGKVGVPDHVLLSPDQLTPEQRDIVRRHTYIGFDTMKLVKDRWGDDRFLFTACEICFAHHERWDGSGYPYGLSGNDIPLAARIVAIADVYDALTTRRVYKGAMTHLEARTYITSESGTHFDPALVEAFLRCEEQFRAMAESPRG